MQIAIPPFDGFPRLDSFIASVIHAGGNVLDQQARGSVPHADSQPLAAWILLRGGSQKDGGAAPIGQKAEHVTLALESIRKYA